MPKLRIPVGATVLLGYVAVSFLYFGWRLLPHPGRPLIGDAASADPQKFVWWFEWWPRAVLSGSNPFVSDAVFAPTGINLAWTTSVPALAAAFSPVTLLFGPTMSYNLAAVLIPAVSAWAAYLLFHYLTASVWASAVGGYLYGFSSLVLAHQLGGHLHVTAVFVPPLVALVLARYLRGDLGDRGLACWVGVLFALQAYISIEVALTLCLMFVVAFALAVLTLPDMRPRLRAALVPTVAGLALSAVLAFPLLYYALVASSPQSVIDTSGFNADLLNLVVPTALIGWSGDIFAAVAARFRGGINEQDSYLGIPALLMIGLLLIRRWTPIVRFLVLGFGFATILTFGTALYVNGERKFALPWALVSDVTILENVIPSRLALYATLAANGLVVLWIATTKGKVFTRPYVLPICAIVALAPAVWRADFIQHPTRLAFFSDGLYRECLPPDETLLVFPFGSTGMSMLWQAESHFWFKMAGGDLTPEYPESFIEDATMRRLAVDYLTVADIPPADLLALARRRGVDRVVSATEPTGVVPGTTDPLGFVFPDRAQMGTFGPPQEVGDVVVSPGCSSPSLTGAVER